MTHELGINDILIKFDVARFVVSRIDKFSIPHMTQNYVYAQFSFDESWQGLTLKTAILSKGGVVLHLPLDENNMTYVPNEFLEEPGTIVVSVYAGDKRTVNEAHIQVIRGGYIDEIPPPPPKPHYTFVKTPENSVPFLREADDEIEYFSTEKDEWRAVVRKDDLELGVW